MAEHTTSTTGPTRPSAAAAAAMVAGPALLLAGFALHPEDQNDPTEILATISEQHGAWVVSHVVLFAAAVLLIPAALALSRLVTGAQRRVANVASGLIIVAAVGLGGAATFEQLLGIGATLPGETPTMVRLIEAAEDSAPMMGMLYLPQGAVVLGFLTMAWALLRSKTVPTWAGATMAVGALAVMAPEPGRCIGVALLLVTFIVALRRSLKSGAPNATDRTSRLGQPTPTAG